MRPSYVAIVCALVLSLLPIAPARASSALHVDGAFFRDARGGAVILRGMNVAGNAKVPPFRPISGPAAFAPMASWGMNVVRLLFTWEAYEPQPGAYDESYLDYYAATVDAAAQNGLFVIVDVHQDAFSRASIGGCGEGLPMWAIPWWVIRATPDNGPSCANWGIRPIADAGMLMSFSAFYADSTGARTHYLAMLGRVAQRLARHEAVIGYDMLNEPWGDEATEISALYADAATAIRSADPTAILFVGPHCLTGAGTRSNLLRPTFTNFAFAPHFYDASVVGIHVWLGNLPDGPFANMRGVANSWGVPLFVGEFGGPASATRIGDYVQALYDELDAALASGTQWVYTPGWNPTTLDGWNMEDLSVRDDKGATRANFVARPYPRRVAGTPTRFSLGNGVVELDWSHDPGAGATTIYVPAQALFGTPALRVTTSGAQLRCATGADQVVCTSSASGPMIVQIRGGN